MWLTLKKITPIALAVLGTLWAVGAISFPPILLGTLVFACLAFLFFKDLTNDVDIQVKNEKLTEKCIELTQTNKKLTEEQNAVQPSAPWFGGYFSKKDEFAGY